MRAARRAAPVLLVLALLTGCAHTFDATGLGVPATLATPAGQAPEGERFSVGSKAVFGLWGAIPLKRVSLEKALAGQLGGGTGLADVRIRVRSTLTDVLISVLTAGLIVPRSVRFEGVVTR